MKKILILLCATVFIIPFLVIPIACEENINLYPGNIVFDDDFYNIPKAKQQLLLTHFYGNDSLQISNEAKFNLLCIFGHDIKYGGALVTRHNVYPTSPKCIFEDYEYEACMRSGCDYYKVTLSYTIPLTCHP